MYKLILSLIFLFSVVATYGAGLTIFKSIRRGLGDFIWYFENIIAFIIFIAIDFGLLWFIFN